MEWWPLYFQHLETGQDNLQKASKILSQRNKLFLDLIPQNFWLVGLEWDLHLAFLMISQVAVLLLVQVLNKSVV